MQKEYKTCPVCGKEITHKGSNAQKYCSEACRRKAHNNNDCVRKHNKDLPRGAKYKAYLAYDCKCAVCGWQASKILHADDLGLSFGFGNELHHITPVCDGGKAEDGNIILLCPNCHKLAHMGILTRKKLKEYTKPIDETCKKRAQQFWSDPNAAQIIYDYFNEKSPCEELTLEYILVMQRADLIARAGYTKLNGFWRGFVDDLEDAIKDWHDADEKELTSDGKRKI